VAGGWEGQVAATWESDQVRVGHPLTTKLTQLTWNVVTTGMGATRSMLRRAAAAVISLANWPQSMTGKPVKGCAGVSCCA